LIKSPNIRPVLGIFGYALEAASRAPELGEQRRCGGRIDVDKLWYRCLGSRF